MRSQSRGPSGDPGINRGRMFCLVAQSCPTLCDPMDCDWPGSSVHGDSSSKPTGVGCHVFLQGIFPTQGSNPGLLHCRRIPYPLSYQGSPNWGSTCFLSWILIQMALCCSVIHWLNLWLPVAPTASRTHLPDPWRHLMISFKSPFTMRPVAQIAAGTTLPLHVELGRGRGRVRSLGRVLSCPTSPPPSSLSNAFLLLTLHWQCQQPLSNFRMLSVLCQEVAGSFHFHIYTHICTYGSAESVLSPYCHVGDFSSCSDWGLLSSCGMQASHCGGFSCCRARPLRHAGFSSCSTWAQ